jgi:hypothetical protein
VREIKCVRCGGDGPVVERTSDLECFLCGGSRRVSAALDAAYRLLALVGPPTLGNVWKIRKELGEPRFYWEGSIDS